MASIFDVAKYILSKQSPMSTWKLQKLCYYSQAWALAWSENVPLFDEDFQAWTNGPVCRDLYDVHSGMYMISVHEFKYGEISNLTEDEIETVDVVLEGYGDKSPFWLKEQTHEEPPWIAARGNTPEHERSTNIITKISMGAYYSSL